MRRVDIFQEWLADRVTWVQYPNIRPADQLTRDAGRTRPPVHFKTAMPIGKRIDLLFLSLALLALGLVGLVVTGGIFYLLFVTLI